MTIFVATAANTYFWQKIAVRAETHDEAHKAFQAYLAGSDSQAAEEYEYESGQAIKDVVSENCDRSQYVYSVDYQDIEADLEGDLADRVTGANVVMIGSGGNG